MSESTIRITWEASRVRNQGSSAVERVQRERLADMVAYSRANSPFYRELYRDLPERVDDPTLLPVVDKKTMMTRFDDWVTDRAVTLKQAQAFADDPRLVGQPFQGRYLLATTSGTSGRRGIFLLDERSQAINLALGILRARDWFGLGDLVPLLRRGGRSAAVIATGGHFVGYAGATGTGKSSRWNRKTMRILSVHTPLPTLVAALNDYQPAMLLGYASVVAMLASEQLAGRLRIAPVLVQPAGESIGELEHDRIASAFRAKVRTAYAATECPFIASSCAYGWLHVASDWVVLEPVDADYQPVAPGRQSHTVLLTNLANRVQPVLRYDLGDGILARADPCPCGRPLPAIKVHGRAGDTLTFMTDNGEQVSVSPLAFGTLLDRTPGIERFQIVQSTPTSLRVHLRLSGGADPDRVWDAVHTELSHLLADNKIDHVRIERADEPPKQSPGGKFRTIILLD